jgi:hypothetical protein
MRVLFSLSLCLLIGSLVCAVSLHNQGESIINYAGEISSTGINTQGNQGNRLQGRGLDTVLHFRKPTLIKEGKANIDKRSLLNAITTHFPITNEMPGHLLDRKTFNEHIERFIRDLIVEFLVPRETYPYYNLGAMLYVCTNESGKLPEKAVHLAMFSVGV